MRFLPFVLLCQIVAAQDPQILIEPNQVLLGDPFSVRLVNLPPGEQVTLRTQASDGDRMYESSVSFVVPADGEIDLAQHTPSSGSYTAADPLGIFWSMRDVGPAESISSQPDTRVATFEMSHGGDVLAQTRSTQLLVDSSVTVSEVRENGIHATFARPAGAGDHPGVIVVGGSDGGIGWQRTTAKLLASHGYAALGLAYFSFEELPGSLEEIPLEYFAQSIAWLQSRDFVDESRIAVYGVSKGGELALLLGSSFPAVKAVVAYVPGSAVFQSVAAGWSLTSSWSRGGEGLPFVPYDPHAATSGADILEIYQASLTNEAAVAKASIPVENTSGPILLLSGMADTIWPSTAMSETVEARLKSNEFPHPVQHFAYPDAGHSISLPLYAGAAASTRNGGTAVGNARASHDAWRQVLAFLDQHLQPQ